VSGNGNIDLTAPAPRLRNTQQSSKHHSWETPREFFEVVERIFTMGRGFDLDAAASDENRLCERYFTAKDSALCQPWGPLADGYGAATVWCNPPYGKLLGEFVRKAWEEAEADRAEVVMLLPPRSDTAWWHEYVMRASGVYCVRGRISFCKGGEPCSQNTFPSVLVHFLPKSERGVDNCPDFRSWCQRCGPHCRCRDAQGLL